MTAWGFDQIPFAQGIIKGIYRRGRMTWLPMHLQQQFMDAKELTSQMKKDEADIAEERFQYG